MTNYKTGKLPFNFIALGILLLALSIWRLAISDWAGVLYLFISLFFLFLRSGVFIDAENKRVKKYVGIFGLNMGKWENIDPLVNLQIIKRKESQTMSVLSVSRTDNIDVYKLFLTLPDHKIELFSGKRNYINTRAEEISRQLQTTVIYTLQ